MHEHKRRLVNEFTMFFFNFNTVVWLVFDIILCGMYIEGTIETESTIVELFSRTHKRKDSNKLLTQNNQQLSQQIISIDQRLQAFFQIQ